MAIITATSCNNTASQPHVANAVAAAQNGDTVVIPAGTCTWTQPILTYCGSPFPEFRSVSQLCLDSNVLPGGNTKSITIKGQNCTLDASGVPSAPNSCPTVLINAISGQSVTYSNYPMIGYATQPNGTHYVRIAHMEIRPSAAAVANCASLSIAGTSKKIRIDHIRFTAHPTSFGSQCQGVIYGGAQPDGGSNPQGHHFNGVMDHCFIDNSKLGVAHYNRSSHSSENGVGTNGDNAWARPNTIGGSDNWFSENNICYNDQSLQSGINSFCHDGWWGNRWVWRYNSMRASKVGAHGTDSSPRGMRHAEIYENTWTGPDGVSPWNLQNSGSPDVASFRSGGGVVFNNRVFTTNFANNNPGAIGGFDRFFSGTNERDTAWGSNGFGMCQGAPPTNSKWDGNQPGQGGWPCIDQVGVGQGDLLTGTGLQAPVNTANPGVLFWPRQVLDPVYNWNNTINGTISPGNGSTGKIIAGRDIINCPGTTNCKSGYTPYTYPHPLIAETEGGVAPDITPPATPQNFQVQ